MIRQNNGLRQEVLSSQLQSKEMQYLGFNSCLCFESKTKRMFSISIFVVPEMLKLVD